MAGVAAGRGGGFGRVISIGRGRRLEVLRRHGADTVIEGIRRVEVVDC